MVRSRSAQTASRRDRILSQCCVGASDSRSLGCRGDRSAPTSHGRRITARSQVRRGDTSHDPTTNERGCAVSAIRMSERGRLRRGSVSVLPSRLTRWLLRALMFGPGRSAHDFNDLLTDPLDRDAEGAENMGGGALVFSQQPEQDVLSTDVGPDSQQHPRLAHSDPETSTGRCRCGLSRGRTSQQGTAIERVGGLRAAPAPRSLRQRYVGA